MDKGLTFYVFRRVSEQMIFDYLIYKAVKIVLKCLLWASPEFVNIKGSASKIFNLTNIIYDDNEVTSVMSNRETFCTVISIVILEEFVGHKAPPHEAELRYSYERLEEGNIRLLLIYRDNLLRIRYSLCSYPLSQAPPFEAVSYRWGNSSETEEIIIDGKPFRTTRTVANILRKRADLVKLLFNHATHIWLDYLCINQEDTKEKNHQVWLMREIYRRAENVRICLEHSYDASKANEFLAKLCHLSTFHRPEELINIFGSDTNSWIALRRMYSQPFFSRVWIIQEVAVAQKICVVHGPETLHWDLVSWGINLLSRYEMVAFFSTLGKFDSPLLLHHAGVVFYTRLLIQQREELRLADAIALCAYFHATDPRDKIFALLGLVTDNLDLRAWVDYTKSTQEVYLQTTRYLLSQETNTLRILNLAGTGCTRYLENLPSWVPDWSLNESAPTLDHSTATFPEYNASGSSSPKVIFDPCPSVIRLKGTCVNSVQILNNAIVFNPSFRPWYQECQNIVEKWSPDPYPTFQSRDEALWRTLLGDRTTRSRPVPAVWVEYYRCMQEVLILSPRRVEAPKFSEEMGPKALKYFSATLPMIVDRRFCITKKGYMGFVPRKTEVGDLVCIFAGAKTPFIIRGKAWNGEEENETYSLVGECFFHGMMDGEMFSLQDTQFITLC
ncbi:hypothetical protein N431DRAFT_551181 [Stipitochalara longipes BDJ]|nr:hypothetical protein N431DRAFT_551181 [Stipitochalara longipes BDJ]